MTIHIYSGNKIINATAVGSPVINNGVASGFSAANYLTGNLQSTVQAGNVNSFEIVFKIKTPTSWTSNGRVINWNGGADSTEGPFIQVTQSSAVLTFYDGSNWHSRTALSNLLNDTEYGLKWVYDGTDVKAYYKDSNGDWILNTTTSLNLSIPRFTRKDFTIGCRSFDSAGVCVWNGSVDLKESYIKINGQTWWDGMKPVYDKFKEVYNGNQAIGYVYNGSQLVWQHNPYPIGTVIANTQTAGSITIYPGTYELKISGAGGTGGHSGANWGNHNGSGGSGACWEGTIKIDNEYTMAWTTGTGAAASVAVSFNGTSMVTAGGGGNAVVNYSTSQGGAAGVVTVQSAFNPYIVSTSKSSDGTKGASTAVSWGDYHTAVTAAPSTMGWGVGESSVNGGRTDGGFYLKRIA